MEVGEHAVVPPPDDTYATLRRMPFGTDDLLSEVRRILWEHWDPIGVNDEPGAFGEYDSYAGPIVSRLRRGTTASEIDSYWDQHLEG